MDQKVYVFTILIDFAKLPPVRLGKLIPLQESSRGLLPQTLITQYVIKLPELCQCDRWMKHVGSSSFRLYFLG